MLEAFVFMTPKLKDAPTDAPVAGGPIVTAITGIDLDAVMDGAGAGTSIKGLASEGGLVALGGEGWNQGQAQQQKPDGSKRRKVSHLNPNPEPIGSSEKPRRRPPAVQAEGSCRTRENDFLYPSEHWR